MENEFLTLEQLRVKWPAVADKDETDVEFTLREANMEVGNTRGVRERLADGELDIETVQFVVERIVRRALKSPEFEDPGVASQSFTTGPFTGQVSFRKPDNGDVYLTKRDKALLGVTVETGRVFSTYMGGIR